MVWKVCYLGSGFGISCSIVRLQASLYIPPASIVFVSEFSDLKQAVWAFHSNSHVFLVRSLCVAGFHIDPGVWGIAMLDFFGACLHSSRAYFIPRPCWKMADGNLAPEGTVIFGISRSEFLLPVSVAFDPGISGLFFGVAAEC